jgi:Putative beta barrel porin-7 (BBP7)
MRSSKLARRLLPALFLGAGSAFAGDPPVPVTVTPPPLESLLVPGVPVGLPSGTEVQVAPPAVVPTPAPTPMHTYTAPVTTPPPVSVYPTQFPADEMFVSAKDNGPGLTWVRAEYLSWSLTGARVPALVTSPPPGPVTLIYAAPGNKVIFGADKELDGHRPGARLTMGSWFNSDRNFGWEASGFWLDRQDDGIRAGSTDGSRSIASSPFINALTGQPTALIISSPGVAYGSTQVSNASRAIWGGEVLGRGLLCSGDGWRLDGLVGYRCIQFNEQLDIHKSIFLLSPLVVPGTQILCDDGITARNKFHGGVLGVDLQCDVCGYLLSARPSVAIGSVENTVNRTGIMGARVPGFADFFHLGGTYNLSSNLGEVGTRDCTVVPQIELRLVKEICPGVRGSIGYTGIYLPQVVRAAEQIDPVVNPNLLGPILPGGPARPAPLLERNSAVLQGLSVGVEVRF